MKLTETSIARALAMQYFNRKYLVVVPNCSWPGSECDVLCVTENLRIIDVEIKISRSDLKADAKKCKWWESRILGYGEEVVKEHAGRLVSRHRPALYEKTARQWPQKVWKHYYAMPKEIWKPELADSMPSKASGILLLSEQAYDGKLIATCERRAMPCKDAEKLSPAAAVDIARLASLRMWESYSQLEAERSQRLDREKAAA
jgi:hypothetical protein